MLSKEKENYLSKNLFKRIYKRITFHPDYLFYKATVVNRKYYIYKNNKKYLRAMLYSFLVNRMASKYNLELYGLYGENLRIWHGNIIINGEARLGDNCQLHGNNCIGNNGGKSPRIGNNVDIGFGAIIIGDIDIADNVTIGANSLVNKSILEENTIYAGVPAKFIKKKEA